MYKCVIDWFGFISLFAHSLQWQALWYTGLASLALRNVLISIIIAQSEC